jgi:cytochrome c-type biogenesis protein
VIEFLFEASGRIATAVQALADGSASFAALALVAIGGLLAGVSPSGLTGALAVLGQLPSTEGRPDRSRGMTVASAFCLGMAASLAAVGLLAAWLGQSLFDLGLSRWLPLLTLVMGLHMMGVIRLGRLPSLGSASHTASGTANAFLLGVPFGLATAPCTLPVLVTVLTVAAAKGSAVFGVVGLAAFALGRSVPVLLLGLFSDQILALPRVHKATPHLRRVAGGLIAVFSLYFLTLGRHLLG